MVSRYDINSDGKVTARDLVDIFVKKGLLKNPPKLEPLQAINLLKLIKAHYGDELERLPTFEAKLYLAALLEESRTE